MWHPNQGCRRNSDRRKTQSFEILFTRFLQTFGASTSRTCQQASIAGSFGNYLSPADQCDRFSLDCFSEGAARASGAVDKAPRRLIATVGPLAWIISNQATRRCGRARMGSFRLYLRPDSVTNLVSRPGSGCARTPLRRARSSCMGTRHHEHILYHRRSGRCDYCCQLFRGPHAYLNKSARLDRLTRYSVRIRVLFPEARPRPHRSAPRAAAACGGVAPRACCGRIGHRAARPAARGWHQRETL